MEPEFYDIYDEARHTPMSALKREYGLLHGEIESDMLDPCEAQAAWERLQRVKRMMEIKDADEADARYIHEIEQD